MVSLRVAQCGDFNVSVHSGTFCDLPYDRFLGTKLGTHAPVEKNYRAVVALSKKKSRSIMVNDVEYRWAFSMDSGYATIVLQHGSGTGQRVEAQTGRWNWGDERSVSPAVVARLIEFAQKQGWDPTTSGPPLRLRDIDQAIGLS